MLIDLICGGAKTRPQPLNTRQSEVVTVSLFFSPAVLSSTTPTHEHFVLSPVSLASRDQDGGLSDSTIDIYDLTEKEGTVNSLIVSKQFLFPPLGAVLCLVDIHVITIFLSDTTASHYWIYSVSIFTKVMQILLETMLAFLWF